MDLNFSFLLKLLLQMFGKEQKRGDLKEWMTTGHNGYCEPGRDPESPL